MRRTVAQLVNRAIEFPTRARAILAILLLAVCLVPVGLARAESVSSGDIEPEIWFDEDTRPGVTQASEGELVFLSPPPESRTLHSINTITVTRTSLDDGWVQLGQCYEGLDAVPAAEVVYQYKKLRRLRIHSKSNIVQAVTRGQTVQLNDVQHGATLCIRAEAQILYPQADGGFLLRNGPFHRRFLDGYFPLHVSMDVQFPSTLLHYVDISPEAQPGFEVDVQDEHMYIDTWFAGALTIEVHFSER
jgi:hypothetical protein